MRPLQTVLKSQCSREGRFHGATSRCSSPLCPRRMRSAPSCRWTPRRSLASSARPRGPTSPPRCTARTPWSHGRRRTGRASRWSSHTATRSCTRRSRVSLGTTPMGGPWRPTSTGPSGESRRSRRSSPRWSCSSWSTAGTPRSTRRSLTSCRSYAPPPASRSAPSPRRWAASCASALSRARVTSRIATSRPRSCCRRSTRCPPSGRPTAAPRIPTWATRSWGARSRRPATAARAARTSGT